MEAKGYWRVSDPKSITGELWKKVDGYDYLISNYGRVRPCDHVQLSPGGKSYRIVSGKIMRQHQTRKGYLKVHLSGKEGKRSFYVHRLVAEAFVTGYAPGLVVNHLNEIKTDNRALNLEWCTSKENSNYGTAKQRLSKALINNPYSSKPVQAFCKDSGLLVATFPSQRETARQLNYALSTVRRYIDDQNRTIKGLVLVSR